LKGLSIFDLIQDDLEQVETLLRERSPGRHEAINLALDHLVRSGGKRLRPALVLLSGHLCGADVGLAVHAAAAAEMLHTATLIHDDLLDGSLMRRGMETLNAQWPPGATVLIGDYAFAYAAYLVSQTDNVRLMRRFAETLMVICDGEVHQMFDERNGYLSRQEYERRIYAKTASLLALSAEAGGILAGADDEVTDALRTYGERLGLAFQIVDDVIDIVADEEMLGKPIGGDLRQGLVTLPVLLFVEREPEHPAVSQTLTQRSSEGVVQEAVQAIAASPAIDQALMVAQEHAAAAEAALSGLADGPYRQALLDLAEFTVRRRF